MKISALLLAGMAAVLVEASRTDQGVETKSTELGDVSVGAAQVQPSRDSEKPSEVTAEGAKVDEEPKLNSAVEPIKAPTKKRWDEGIVWSKRG